MKKTKRIKLNFFNIVVLISMLGAAALLIHDFIFWGVMPMFTGNFYCLTYFGLFVDVIAIGLLEVSIQIIKEW